MASSTRLSRQVSSGLFLCWFLLLFHILQHGDKITTCRCGAQTDGSFESAADMQQAGDGREVFDLWHLSRAEAFQ